MLPCSFIVQLFEKAAKQGFAKAQYNLGVMYSNGLGFMYLTGEATGSSDLVTGCAWIYISQDRESSAYCDNNLTLAQMTKTLHLMNQLEANIK